VKNSLKSPHFLRMSRGAIDKQLNLSIILTAMIIRLKEYKKTHLNLYYWYWYTQRVGL